MDDADLVFGSGNDKIYTGDASNDVDGGAGADYIGASISNLEHTITLIGGASADTLVGTSGRDTIEGGTRKDHLTPDHLDADDAARKSAHENQAAIVAGWLEKGA